MSKTLRSLIASSIRRGRSAMPSQRGWWHQRPLGVEPLEERALLAAVDAGMLSAGSEQGISGEINTRREVDYYWVDVSEPQRARVEVTSSDGLDSRIQLFAVTGEKANNASSLRFETDQLVDLLAESNDRDLSSLDPLLDLHLDPGSSQFASDETTAATADRFYVLAISASPTATDAAAVGEYRVSVDLAAASPPFQRIPVGARPRGMASGDFNRDGILDLAVANEASDEVFILLGLGDGTFRSDDATIPVGTTPVSIVAAHLNLNDDDDLDLAVANSFSDGVSILLGDGKGGFETQEPISVGVEPEAIAALDIDGDKDVDLMTVQKSGDVTILWNQPQAAGPDFVPETEKVLVDRLKGIDFQDLILARLHDGTVLLAVTGEDSSTVEIRVKGLKDDAFHKVSQGEEPIDIMTPYSLTHGLMDDDEKLDLVVVSDLPDTAITVLLGQGGGGFADPIVTRLVAVEDTENLVIGDFNQDNIVDVIASAEGRPGQLLVLLGQGNGTFQEPMRISVDGDPEEVVAGHFNSDRFLDLAVASRAADSVSVFLGQGDGTFFQQPRHPVGTDPEAIIAKDFNRDGRLDIATANIVSDTVSLLLATGRNAYEDVVNYEVGKGPWDLATGFLDGEGDRHLDIVTANRFSNDVSILWGKPVGFEELPLPSDPDEPQRWKLVKGEGPSAIRLADLDGNGLLDIVTQNDLTDDFSVFFGDGNRTFEPEEVFDPGESPYDLEALFPPPDLTSRKSAETGRFQPEFTVVADVNNDEVPDLITSALLVQDISVRLGIKPNDQDDDTVWFGKEWRFRTPVKEPRTLLAVDFDGDGEVDLAIAHTDEKRVSILWGGGGQGIFDTKILPQVIEVGTDPRYLATDDFDGDGDLDLVVANSGDGTVRVLLLNKVDKLSLDKKPVEFRLLDQAVDVGGLPNGIVVAKFNGDRWPDLAVLNSGKSNISILLNNGVRDGTFSERFVHTDCENDEDACRLAVGSDPVAIAAGDFDENGLVDLAVMTRLPAAVTVFMGEGNGNFSSPRHFALSDDDDIAELARGRHRGLVAADLDEDGHLDLATASRDGNGILLFNGDGQGDFSEQEFLDIGGDESRGQDPLSLVAADLNQDGWPELVTANRKSDNVSVRVNAGNGQWDSPLHFGIGIGPEARLEVDLDGDGSPETLVATRDDEITVNQRSTLPGGLQGPPIPKPSGVPDRLARGPLIGDLDGDAINDIVTMNRAGEVFVRFGQGDAARFRPPQILVDADGSVQAQDVAIVTAMRAEETEPRARLAILDRGSATANTLHVYSLDVENGIVSGLREERTLQLDVGRSRITATDLDHDGSDDLVLSNLDDGTVSIRLQDDVGQFVEVSKIAVGQGPWDVAVFEAPDERLPRLALTNRQSGEVSLLVGEEGQGYREQHRLRGSNVVYDVFPDQNVNLRALRDEVAGLTPVDINADGYMDLIVTSAAFSSALVLYATGPDGFTDPQPLEVDLPGPAPRWSLEISMGTA